MINQALIDQEVENFKQAVLNRRTEFVKNLSTIGPVFGEEILTKLKTYVNTVGDTKWQTVEGQESYNRRKIVWDSDSVVEELHIIGEQLTDFINETFPDAHRHFIGIALWKDWAGYSLTLHADNPLIDISAQIYLYDAPKNCGTTFMVNGTRLDVPYQHNTGYFMVDPTGMLHRTTTVTPPGVTRYSLYVIWSQQAKYVPNA
jgi:hypothetical protein